MSSACLYGFLPIIIVIIEIYLLSMEWILISKPEIKELQVIFEVPGLGVLTYYWQTEEACTFWWIIQFWLKSMKFV